LPQPLLTAWLQKSSLRPLDTIPAQTQHDDITAKMFEGGKCNPTFLFIYFKRKFKQLLGWEKNAKVSSFRKNNNSALQEERRRAHQFLKK